MSIPIYLAFSPEEAAEAAAASAHLACMGYQLAPDTPALLARQLADYDVFYAAHHND